MEKARIWMALGLILLVLWGCAGRKQVSRPVKPPSPPPPTQPLEPPEEKAQGTYHVVQRGETLWRICRAYGVDLQLVAEMNNIKDVSQIRVGQKIFIRGVSGTSRVNVPRQRAWEAPDPSPRVQTFPGLFIWPAHGNLTRSFEISEGIKHKGVDISAPLGSQVVAAAAGEVRYRGQIQGYGNVLILQHSEEFTTVYAHLKDWIAQDRQKVRQGEAVALVGDTGRSNGAHLHFEIRQNNQARNPLFYLPENSK